MKKVILSIISFFVVNNSFALKESYNVFSQALIFEKEGKYDMAMEYYKKAIEMDPQPFLYKQALNLALQTGKVKEAKEYSQYIINSDTNSAENWFLYGNALWIAGEIQEAKKAFEKVIELDPNYADAYYQLSSLNSDNTEKAISYLNKFMELKPDYKAEVYYQIALIYESKKNYKKMLEYIEKSIKEDESYLKPRYLLAYYYESKNDLKTAIEKYNEILKIDPSNVEILNHLGEIYLSPSINDIEKAKSYFDKAVEIDTSNAVALYWLSLISEEKKDYEKAVYYLEKYSEPETNPAVALKLSYYYTLLNNYPKAISLLEKLHSRWPENLEITYYLALGYEDTEKYDKAYNLLVELSTKNFQNDDAILQLAIVCEKLNYVSCFEENFRKLLLKKPDDPMILNYLGYSLIDRGLKLDEAIEMVKKALEKDPDNGAYLDSLGWGYYKKGDYEKAKEYLEKSIKSINSDPIIWEHIANLYEKINDIDRAWLAYKISYALSSGKKQKLSEKAKKLTNKIKLPDQVYNYLDSFSLKGNSFSAPLKLTINFKNRKIKLDGALYNNENKFGILITGPLMMPIWRIEYEDNSLTISDLNIDGIDSQSFNKLAKEVFFVLKDMFSGELIKGPYTKSDIDFFQKQNMKLYFSYDSLFIDRIKFKGENKFEINFKKYELVKNYLIPAFFELKSYGAVISFEIDVKGVNIEKSNDLLKNWK